MWYSFHVLSDQTITVTPETSIVGAGVADPDKVLFRPIIKKFNWTMNKQYKLVACTAMANNTQGAEFLPLPTCQETGSLLFKLLVLTTLPMTIF
eukprot:SAG11_NODE_1275_length_5330_cov_2.437966_1_plen_94_part_00